MAWLPVAAAVIGTGLQAKQYADTKKTEKRQKAAAEEAFAQQKALIEGQAKAEATAQQEARKAFERRAGEQKNILAQTLARQNLQGSPVATARTSALERQSIQSGDVLAAEFSRARAEGEKRRAEALADIAGRRGQFGASYQSPTAGMYGEAAQSAFDIAGRTYKKNPWLVDIFGDDTTKPKPKPKSQPKLVPKNK